MPKQFETGHVINVDNFYELIQFVNTYAPTYQPSALALQSVQLTAKHAQAVSSLQAVTDQVTTYNNYVNARMEVFAPLRSTATRVINALEVSGASAQVIKDAKEINRKLQGKRALTTPQVVPPGSPPPTTISASQQSYAQLIAHWAALISLLTAEPLYLPNETALKLVALQTLQDNMTEANDAVAEAWAQISGVRNSRDTTLYDLGTGLVPTALLVKKYVKALYGAESVQFGQVNHIKFTTIKRD